MQRYTHMHVNVGLHACVGIFILSCYYWAILAKCTHTPDIVHVFVYACKCLSTCNLVYCTVQNFDGGKY